MKKILCVALAFAFFTGLFGQKSTWQVYRSGRYPSGLIYRNSEIWVSSEAGIMRWNPSTNQSVQYDISNAPAQMASIYCMCKTQNDDIWGGGYYGVVHFDGETWEYFDSSNSVLPSASINKIVEDQSGGIWLASSVGIYRYYQGSWTVFNSSNSILPANQQVMALTVDPNNKIWVGTYNGAWSYNGNTWAHYTQSNSTLPNDTVNCIAFEANGTGWFGNDNGVAKYVNGTWQQYTSLDGYMMGQITGIYIDDWQRVWLYNHDSLLSFNGFSYQYYPINIFADYTVWFKLMVVDENQTIWLGLFDTYSPKSLIKFDGINITRYPICEMPLPSKDVQAIFKGYDNKLWIGTAESKGIGGYLSIQTGECETFGMYNTDMPCDHVWALAQDQELNMWVGTCLGLLKTGPGGSVVFHSNDTGVGASYIRAICPVGNDEVWIGTNTGVSRYTNGTWSVLSTAEAGMSLSGTNVIKTDATGRVWIGCSAGVCSYWEGQFTVYPEATNAKDIAFGLDGKVWVARGMLSYLQNGQWTHYNSGNSGMPANNVNCVAVDIYNVVWAGTSSTNAALYRLEDNDWRVYNSTNSTIDGIQINKLYVDEHNTKWIGGKQLYLFNENGVPSEGSDQYIQMPVCVSNYPNPFREATTISYKKETTSPLKVNIYNLKGQKVWSYTDSKAIKGQKDTIWNGKDQQGNSCAAGVYLIRVAEGNRSIMHKAIKLH